MTTSDELSDYFEDRLKAYVKNRMYPPAPSKGKTMLTLTIQHHNSIVHAEFYLLEQKTKYVSPHQSKELDDDLVLLGELKQHVLSVIMKRNEHLPVF